MAHEIGECGQWHFLGRAEWERWKREECEDDTQRSAVARFLTDLAADPLLIEGTPVGLGFQGRFFRYLEAAPVIVTWLVAEEICVVTVLRIESIPS